MAWHLLEKIIEHSATHSTILGKWWIVTMFVFRIIVVASIGDSVYDDEQDKFVCNTKQPGCKQVCYSSFAPISHIRFWAFQIIATGTPPLIFIVLAIHKLAKIPSRPVGAEAQKEAGTQTMECYASISSESSWKKEEKTGSVPTKSAPSMEGVYSNPKRRFETYHSNSIPPPKYEKVCRENKLSRTNATILKAYVISVIFRTLIEGGCVWGQFLLYGWRVPVRYLCRSYPCLYTVECYISRPMEKTIFLYFMFVVGALCTFINGLELLYLVWRRARREWSRRKKRSLSESSFILGTCPISDVPRIHNRHHGEPRQPARVIRRTPGPAPPGFYIPHVDPPSEKYRSPANGFPHIRLRAASFTTSESDVTTDSASSIGSFRHTMEENARRYL